MNALLLVNVVGAVLLYALVTVVIPVFSQERETAGNASAWRLVWAIAGWVGMGLILLAALVAVFPEVPSALFDAEGRTGVLTQELVRIMAPGLLLQGISALFTALLQLHDRFGVPAAVGVAFNLGIMAGVIAGQGSLGIEAAAWGLVIGALFQVLLQLPQFVRVARKERVRPAFRHPRLGAVALAAVPVMGASLIQQVNSFFDRFLANTLDEGKVTQLAYANSLGSAPRAALLVPFLTPLFPLVARMVAQGRDDAAAKGIHRICGILGLVGVPAALLLAVYSRETAQLLLGHGKCDTNPECVSGTSEPLVFYSLAIYANFLSIFLNRALAAANLQRAVFVATTVSVVVTCALDVVLVGPFGLRGIAAATLIGVTVNLLHYGWYVDRRFGAFSPVRLARQQARLLACAVPLLVVVLAADEVLPTDHRKGLALVWPLAAKVALGVLTYLAAARILARPELREAGGAVTALVRRRRPAPAG
ncbi:MAG: polysaccharide biosynthesis C-terminal domain-containing protein [Thermoleophilia bacterium]|nr:polysaccharide biosynthesis C-terminal domain-containing protein [Thermoleophilia bacterium]